MYSTGDCPAKSAQEKLDESEGNKEAANSFRFKSLDELKTIGDYRSQGMRFKSKRNVFTGGATDVVAMPSAGLIKAYPPKVEITVEDKVTPEFADEWKKT